MKKITSLLLALVMVFSMSTVAFATDDYETLVSYTGDGQSVYEVTVPATLAPGGSGKVKVSGTWATNMTVNVTAPETVTLTNDIDGSTKVLDVEFDGISQAGDNTNSILVNATISVEQITNALFGTWSGTIVYTVTTTEEEGPSVNEYTIVETSDLGYYWEATSSKGPMFGVNVYVYETFEDSGTTYTVTGIDSNGFGSILYGESLTLPTSIKTIKANAFTNFGYDVVINYEGTKAQWDEIDKEDGWNAEGIIVTVNCTDGEITL